MGLTHLDCFTISRSDPKRAGSSLAPSSTLPLSVSAFTPFSRPGAVVAAVACGLRDDIASRVACTVAIETVSNRFADALQASDYFQTPRALIEPVYRDANREVYELSHRLASGGRMGTHLVSLTVLDGVLYGGRVGQGWLTLLRSDELYPLFEPVTGSPPLGIGSSVTAELASLPLEPHDVLVLSHTELHYDDAALIVRHRDDRRGQSPRNRSTTHGWESHTRDSLYCFAFGPDVIYLEAPVISLRE